MTTTMALLDIARGYVQAGLSVIPILADGSKKPVYAWKEFQKRQPKPAELAMWFAGSSPYGIAVICGTASDRLEVLDFETAESFRCWAHVLAELVPGLAEALPRVRTPSGGVHVYYRCDTIAGNQKLARMTAEEALRLKGDPKKDTLIETRGEGGYVLAPGCPAACHETGQCYEMLSEVGLDQVPILNSSELRQTMHDVARSLNEHVERGLGWDAPPQNGTGNRPGDDFNRRAGWEEVLMGWTLARRIGAVAFWRRPGKDGNCWSATTGHCKNEQGQDLLYVFTSNAHPFQPEKSYSRFAAYTLINHAGDYKAAARALAGKGYGEQRPQQHANRMNGHAGINGASGQPHFGDAWEGSGEAPPKQAPQAATQAAAPSFPAPIPASLLRKIDSDARWLWEGCLARGGITLLSALWKVGKSTLLSHMLRALGEGAAGSFAGLDVQPGRVLYVTEEHESLWADRRDALGIGDHVHFQIRPFLSKPDWGGWSQFLLHLKTLQETQPYDLLVMDTISNLWPVRDENDAAQVQSALMPLHGLGDSSKLLVHHMRKGDGQEATAARGSGAFSAFADILLELRRFNAGDRCDRRRVLSGYGRYKETPEELVLELDADGGGYAERGNRGQIARMELAHVIVSILPCEPPGLTCEEIISVWPEDVGPRRQRLLETLHRGAEELNWRQEGLGRRGSPFRWWIPAQ